jgi:hypothetical protein
VLCGSCARSSTAIISSMQSRACAFAYATRCLQLSFYWPHTLVPQSLPSSEQSGMPPLDSLFTPPYSWLQKGPHSGNVQRSLTSGNRAAVSFNGHVHRSQPAGGCGCMWRVSVVDVLWCRALCLVLECSSVTSFEIVCLACVHPPLRSTYQDLLCRDVAQWFEGNDVVEVRSSCMSVYMLRL